MDPAEAEIVVAGEALEPRTLVWEGRTGRGQPVRLFENDAWLELIYYEFDGETVRGGLALNPLYAARLAKALVGVIARRAWQGSALARSPDAPIE